MGRARERSPRVCKAWARVLAGIANARARSVAAPIANQEQQKSTAEGRKCGQLFSVGGQCTFSLLEADVGKLRDAYAEVIRSSPKRKVPLARDLLGDPKLDRLPVADGAKFPQSDDQEIRQALLQEAQRAIVCEELQPAGYGELIDR